jgi:hypothetical protein
MLPFVVRVTVTWIFAFCARGGPENFDRLRARPSQFMRAPAEPASRSRLATDNLIDSDVLWPSSELLTSATCRSKRVAKPGMSHNGNGAAGAASPPQSPIVTSNSAAPASTKAPVPPAIAPFAPFDVPLREEFTRHFRESEESQKEILMVGAGAV